MNVKYNALALLLALTPLTVQPISIDFTSPLSAGAKVGYSLATVTAAYGLYLLKEGRSAKKDGVRHGAITQLTFGAILLLSSAGAGLYAYLH